MSDDKKQKSGNSNNDSKSGSGKSDKGRSDYNVNDSGEKRSNNINVTKEKK